MLGRGEGLPKIEFEYPQYLHLPLLSIHQIPLRPRMDINPSAIYLVRERDVNAVTTTQAKPWSLISVNREITCSG
jgi:hypothetical protein